MMICANCGIENAADDLYCGRCGYRLSESAAAVRHYPSRATILRRELAILGTGLTVLLLAAFGTWYALGYARSPIMIVRRFVDADVSGQFSRQQPLIVNRWDAQMVLSGFQAVRRQIGRSPFQGCRIDAPSINGQTAYVTVNVPFRVPAVPGFGTATPGPAPGPPPAPTVPIEFVLLFENGEWKIDASQTFANATGALAAAGYAQIAPNLPNLGLPNLNLPGLIPPGGVPNLPVPPPGPPVGPSMPPGSGAL